MRAVHKKNSEEYVESFMRNLRLLMESRGLTGNGFADAINVGHGTIHRYLNSSRMPNVAYIITVAEYFGVSIDWLLGMTPDQKNSISPEAQKLLRLYNFATKDDRKIIDAVLSKYSSYAEEHENS